MSAARPMTDSTTDRSGAADDSGRFPIEAAARTMLPPAKQNTGEILSLEDLGGSVVESKPRTAPPPPPPRAAGPSSGVFPSGHKPADPEADLAAFAEKLISLSPIYSPRETAQGERAVLDVEDLSLRPDNPYLASSLVPPSEPSRAPRILLWAAVPVVAAALVLAATLAAAGWAKGTARSTTERARQATVEAKRGSAPTAVPAAAPIEPAAETAVAAAEPTVATVVPAESSEPAAVTASSEPTIASEPTAAPKAPAQRPALVHAARPTAEPVAPVAALPAVTNAAPAVPAPSAPAAAAAPVGAQSGAALPAAPTREQVAAGFELVRAQLVQCAAGQHGVAQLAVTIANTGRISHALVEGAFSGTPEGSCMARAVRGARFPQFGQPSLKVSYPVAF